MYRSSVIYVTCQRFWRSAPSWKNIHETSAMNRRLFFVFWKEADDCVYIWDSVFAPNTTDGEVHHCLYHIIRKHYHALTSNTQHVPYRCGSESETSGLLRRIRQLKWAVNERQEISQKFVEIPNYMSCIFDTNNDRNIVLIGINNFPRNLSDFSITFKMTL